MYIEKESHKLYTFNMNKNGFVRVIVLTLIFFFSTNLNAIPLDNIKEYTLENGLTVFVLQDTSTPLIRIEYTVRAGFSNQTKETSGFFKLYTNIFQIVCSSSNLELETAQCNADSSRYCTTIVPSRLQETLTLLSRTAFSINYSDSILSQELSLLKKETAEEAESAGGFINAAIDSRVFSEFPWKHDSGVYPALFNKTTTSKARNILSIISDRWYTPQNSALFISGNINEDTILSLVQDTFGHYYSSVSIPVSRKSEPINFKKKFVLHDSEFSAEMTQIVIQYTSLNIEENELLATLLNNDGSSFKYNLVNLPQLAIPGNEYINAAAAHKKDSSRLIIQSLLQIPEAKEYAKTTSLEQVDQFIQSLKESLQNCSQGEFIYAQQNAIYNLSLINSSSSDFMAQLSAYWGTAQFDSFVETTFSDTTNSSTAENYFSRSQKLSNLQKDEILSKLLTEEPFVFVIINSSDFKKNKKAYENAGFEEINTSNAAWYNQKIFTNYKDKEQEDFDLIWQYGSRTAAEEASFTKNFYSENISLLKQAKLSNGIQLYSKNNNNSSDLTLMLSISGGKLSSADDNGFEEALINLLAANIQKEINVKQQEGKIFGNPSVDYDCQIQTGTITIECSPYDFEGCCKAISDAIIYNDILPSQADRAIANRQYKKRLENGTVSFQMLAAIMKELYPKTDFPKIFEAKKDVLTNTTYQKILENYPSLLNAGKYSVILTGLVPENAEQILEATLGLLSTHSLDTKTVSVQSKLKTGSTKKTVKVTHTFLTDIPAEKAGPMPAKLIPTKEFLDPVIYVFKISEPGTKEHSLTLAIFKYLEELVQKQIAQNSKLTQAKAVAGEYYALTDTITFSIMNVANQKEADACFSAAVMELNELLNSEKQSDVIRNIKDKWIMDFMSKTLTNTGTAQLLQKGLELIQNDKKVEYYLQEFNFVENAQREDFLSIMNDIPVQAPLRFYAK